MNEINKASKSKTVNSVEIAKVTGKHHSHVMKSIEVMYEKLRATKYEFKLSDVMGTYKDYDTGKVLRCYYLPERECLTLALGYTVELRARIIDRWQVTANKMPEANNRNERGKKE